MIDRADLGENWPDLGASQAKINLKHVIKVVYIRQKDEYNVRHITLLIYPLSPYTLILVWP
jgi:hypothetical protein